MNNSWYYGVLGAGEEGDDRGWDGWMASLTRWTWVWVKSGSWWWTGRPGMLWFMGSQRVGHDWATGLNWTELIYSHPCHEYILLWNLQNNRSPLKSTISHFSLSLRAVVIVVKIRVWILILTFTSYMILEKLLMIFCISVYVIKY